jgi:hypothetical protein
VLLERREAHCLGFRELDYILRVTFAIMADLHWRGKGGSESI